MSPEPADPEEQGELLRVTDFPTWPGMVQLGLPGTIHDQPEDGESQDGR